MFQKVTDQKETSGVWPLVLYTFSVPTKLKLKLPSLVQANEHIEQETTLIPQGQGTSTRTARSAAGITLLRAAGLIKVDLAAAEVTPHKVVEVGEESSAEDGDPSSAPEVLHYAIVYDMVSRCKQCTALGWQHEARRYVCGSLHTIKHPLFCAGSSRLHTAAQETNQVACR